MRKTENDELLASAHSSASTVQLSLPVQSPTILSDRDRQLRENFEHFCLQLRAESSELLLIAQMMFPEAEYKKLQEVSNEHFRQVKAQYDLRHPALKRREVPHPHAWIDYQAKTAEFFPEATKATDSKKKKDKVYNPWPLERRQRDAVRRLLLRADKRFGRQYALKICGSAKTP